MDSSLFARSAIERNFRARRPITAQLAEKRAWHGAEHANINQRDDPTWISSLPRVKKCTPESLKQSKKKCIFSVLAREMLRLLLDREAVGEGNQLASLDHHGRVG